MKSLPSSSSPLFFILGSTATRKTDLSVDACQSIGGEIINCDSIQVYDHVCIGAAKPSAEQLSQAKFHLVGHIKPPQKCTAGQYRREALSILQSHFQPQSSPQPDSHSPMFVTGGTGFYFLALEKGMFDVPDIPATIRESVNEQAQTSKGLEELYKELVEKDFDYAKKVGAKDTYRIQRAVEVMRTTGRSMAQIRQQFQPEPLPWTVKKVGLFREPESLLVHIKARTIKMLDEGLIEEVEALRMGGLGQWSPMLSVGYKETQAYLDGRLNKENLAQEIIKSTMKFAKRQRTWFKRDLEVHWFNTDTQYDQALDWIKKEAGEAF